MVFAVHSNTSYLNEMNDPDKASSHSFMSANNDIPRGYDTVLKISQIIKAIMSSVAKADLKLLQMNVHKRIYIH